MSTETKYNLLRDRDDEMHIIPKDSFDHEYSNLCDCEPYQDPVNIIDLSKGTASRKVYIHRPMRKDTV